ncbi:MAG TPA: nuclear transport factor 2 family protein, partial [Anaerolineaceae bacterium]|nr:nuclear transport factor 2 family protein [Anaerolineaceae bacterium]
MGLKGKGFFIWKVKDVEGGNPEAIASAAQAAGYTHVLVKIADGSYPYNIDRATNVDLAEPVVHALRQRGIAVWGWHYVYGNGPVGEANIAIRRLEQLNLEGYVVDAEAEYKEPGKAAAAQTYMDRLRRRFPDLPIALSSFRFPAYHPQFPWKAFLEKCDLNMPQVYWEKAHNPGAQLRRTVREFQTLAPARPVIPTGPAYTVSGWAPSNADTTEFFETCRELGLPAANFFSWDECRSRLPDLWDHISAYHWLDGNAVEDIASQYISALNSGDANRVMALYVPFAIHITPARTVQGADGIKAWFGSLFKE